jgi:hypothetical protein
MFQNIDVTKCSHNELVILDIALADVIRNSFDGLIREYLIALRTVIDNEFMNRAKNENV